MLITKLCQCTGTSTTRRESCKLPNSACGHKHWYWGDHQSPTLSTGMLAKMFGFFTHFIGSFFHINPSLVEYFMLVIIISLGHSWMGPGHVFAIDLLQQLWIYPTAVYQSSEASANHMFWSYFLPPCYVNLRSMTYKWHANIVIRRTSYISWNIIFQPWEIIVF